MQDFNKGGINFTLVLSCRGLFQEKQLFVEGKSGRSRSQETFNPTIYVSSLTYKPFYWLF